MLVRTREGIDEFVGLVVCYVCGLAYAGKSVRSCCGKEGVGDGFLIQDRVLGQEENGYVCISPVQFWDWKPGIISCSSVGFKGPEKCLSVYRIMTSNVWDLTRDNSHCYPQVRGYCTRKSSLKRPRLVRRRVAQKYLRRLNR